MIKLNIIILLAAFALTSCTSAEFQNWKSNPATQSELSDLQTWAYDTAKGFVTSWITSHLGATRKSAGSAKAQFIAKYRAAAHAHAPQASVPEIDAALGAAFDQATTQR